MLTPMCDLLPLFRWIESVELGYYRLGSACQPASVGELWVQVYHMDARQLRTPPCASHAFATSQSPATHSVSLRVCGHSFVRGLKFPACNATHACFPRLSARPPYPSHRLYVQHEFDCFCAPVQPRQIVDCYVGPYGLRPRRRRFDGSPAGLVENIFVHCPC